MRRDFIVNTPKQKFFFALFIIISSFLIFSFIAFLISLPFFNFFKLNIDLNDLSKHQNVMVLKYLQIIQTIGLFIIPALILSYLFNGSIKSLFDYKIKPRVVSICILLLIMITSIPVLNYLVDLNSNMVFPKILKAFEQWMRESENEAAKITEAFLKVYTTKGLLFNIFLIGILPALGEELIFRGILQRIFIDWTKNIHAGILISAFIFSAIHLQFYGFLPRFLLGAFFGYLLVWSGTIWLPIFAHFVNNTVSVIVSYLINIKIIDGEIENFGSDTSTYLYTVLSLLTALGLIFVLYKIEKQNKIYQKDAIYEV